MTVLDLIKSSLRLIGAIASGESPNGTMSIDALEALNLMLGSWHNEGLLSLTEQQAFNVVSGTCSYTIGTGKTWVGNKPLDIISAKLRDSDNSDYALKRINEKEYLKIYSKSDTGTPFKFAYVPSEAFGTIYLYYTPDTNYTITLLSQKAFVEYTKAQFATAINLPSGYLAALKYNLALELSPEYSLTIDQLIIKKADDYLLKLKKTNLKKASTIGYDGIFSGNLSYDIDTDTMN